MKKLITLILLTFCIAFTERSNAQCITPANPAAGYNSDVTTFTWDAVPGAVSYRVQLKSTTSSSWGSPTSGYLVTANSLSLTGVLQSLSFYWRVCTNCSSSQSAYTSAQTFTVPCPEPGGLTTTNITGTSAILNWTAAAGYNSRVSNFVISFKKANTNNPWISLGQTSGTSINISGLQSNTVYDWCVNQKCSYFLSNPVISQFTTLYVPCDIPINLSSSGMTSNQATLGWNSVNGGSSYSVRYKPTGTGTWLGPIITNTPGIVLTGLNSETLYDWNVSANCNNGNASTNAPQKQFTTYSSNCMSYGVNTAEWIDFFSLGTISRTSGAEIGGYYKSSLATDLVIASAGNTVAISPGFTAGVTIGEYYAVYIDYNRNGSYADAGETVVAPVLWTGSSSTANHTSTFTVSSNAVAGPAKMRVILRRAGSSINPCNTGFFGETEDYDITLVAAVNNLVNETGNKSITDFTKTEKNTPALTISPNPSDGLFIVEVPDSFKGEKYEILNMTGTIMQQGKLHGINRFNINIDSKAKGAYYLTVYDVKLKKLSAKLIVQ